MNFSTHYLKKSLTTNVKRFSLFLYVNYILQTELSIEKQSIYYLDDMKQHK